VKALEERLGDLGFRNYLAGCWTAINYPVVLRPEDRGYSIRSMGAILYSPASMEEAVQWLENNQDKWRAR